MTGCERILARLEEGPATAAELYATTYTVVHSRIADLRKRGHVITCDHVPGETGPKAYLYQLQGSAESGEDTPSRASALSPQPHPLEAEKSALSDSAEQLSLAAA